MLPFSLWRSNALWNLLPADTGVNGSKSDRLPERKLLLARRDAVIGCWEVARDKRPLRPRTPLELIRVETLSVASGRRAAP